MKKIIATIAVFLIFLSAIAFAPIDVTYIPNPEPTAGELRLEPSAFTKDKTAQLVFSFKASVELPKGYLVYIADEKATKDDVKEELQEFTAGDWDGKVKLLYEAADRVEANASISDRVGSAGLAVLNGMEKGKYLVMVTEPEEEPTTFIGAFLEIKEEGAVPPPPPATGDNIMEALAQINEKLVEGVFGE